MMHTVGIKSNKINGQIQSAERRKNFLFVCFTGQVYKAEHKDYILKSEWDVIG